MALNIEDFVAKTKKLISKERDAEIAETKILHENVPPKLLERRGLCLLRLKIATRRTGLYGRTILVFEPIKEMPSHSLTPGDIIGLSLSAEANMSENIASGIISRVTNSALSVAFDDDSNESLFDLDDTASYKIVKLANDVTYRRVLRALTDLDGGRGSSQLVSVLFGQSDLSVPLALADFTFFNDNLDGSQKEAVRFALGQREVAIVHGPPGTGKTTTVTEIIRQAVKSNLKVLACAPSNIAVDNLVEKLSVSGTSRIVRLGHPARLLPTIQRHSLDAIVASSDETKLVEDVRKDIDKALVNLKKVRDKGERHRCYNEIKLLRRELRQRESAAVTDILTRATVVLATLTTASGDGPLSHLCQQMFDLVVVDECSQAMEAACWIALLRGNRCVLAGDHHQLPPTILSDSAAKEGLAMTLMERLLIHHKHDESDVVRMLTTQYRMHDDIMRWSSEQMYEGRLVSHPSVASHLLRDITGVTDNENTCTALLLIDTAGCELGELDIADNESKGNEGEADVVTMHVNKLIASGLPAEDIAVIAPYNLQVELLRLRLSQSHPRLEIKSVDGFQGREKEAVVISLVRSNIKGEVGFLAEDRRINVAVTRARRHLAVVCDTETVCRHAFIKSLVDHITSCGEIRSAEQYIQDGALSSVRPTSDKLELVYRVTPVTKDKKLCSEKDNHKPASSGKQIAMKQPKNIDKDRSKPLENKDQTHTVQDGFSKILLDFVEDHSASVYTFPCSLSSFERKLVHEISEQLGLLHVSVGESTERHIEVSKHLSVSVGESTERHFEVSNGKQGSSTTSGDSTSVRTQAQATSAVVSKSVSADAGVHDASSSSSSLRQERAPVEQSRADSLVESCCSRRCEACGREVPMSNWQLHVVRCVRVLPQSVSQDSRSEKSCQSQGIEAKKTKAKKVGGRDAKFSSIVERQDGQDVDALLAAIVRADKTCSATKCKNSTATLGQICAFCRLTFCLSHHLAEVHGCGDEAKRQARATVAREGKVYPGSGVPNKKPDAVRRARLESKLSGRLSEMAEQRKKKPKEDKK